MKSRINSVSDPHFFKADSDLDLYFHGDPGSGYLRFKKTTMWYNFRYRSLLYTVTSKKVKKVKKIIIIIQIHRDLNAKYSLYTKKF